MFRILLFALAGVLLASPSYSQLLVNKAHICFDNKGARGLISGHVAPIGCFSSSCTRVVERHVTLGVNADTGVITVETRIHLKHTGAKVCTRDCGGGGRSTFDYRFFPPRVYKVMLGGKHVGDLDLRQKVVRRCFGGKP